MQQSQNSKHLVLLPHKLTRDAQYRAGKEEHRRKREVYIRLHREIKAHEADVCGLQVAFAPCAVLNQPFVVCDYTFT